jgi:hypothetical protein
MRFRRAWHVASAIVGCLVGAGLVLSVGGVSFGRRTEPVAPPPTPDYRVSEPTVGGDARLLLAWSPMGSGGLPLDAERRIETLPAVSDATTVQAGLVWMERSVAADGAVVDDPPAGMRIPMEVAIIEPGEYGRFVAPGEREAFAGLSAGEAVIPETEATLRGSRAGLALDLGGTQLTVTDVVSDVGTNGYEVMMAPPVPPDMKVVERFLLIHLERPSARPAIVKELRSLLTSGQVLRVRAQGETPFLRYGDAVAPGLLVKKNFGEFAARPLPDGTIEIDPAWENVNILTSRVPVLGEVTCHRAMFAQLRRAMREIGERGLSFVVNKSQYGGCFGPRFISRDPRGRLSHHSWGIAIDMNVAENPFGTKADQDQRLVEAMERAGFTWGGRWLVPDGMHFEWARFP